MRKILAAFSVIPVLLSGCRSVMDLSCLPAPGVYYVLESGGEIRFFCPTSLSSDSISGYGYSSSDGPEAPRREMSIRIPELGGGLIGIDGFCRPYVAPGFKPEQTGLFLTPRYGVSITEDIVYGTAKGYWQSLPGVEARHSRAFTEGYMKSFKRHDLDLTLDLYRPDSVTTARPLILFLHGGAFYFGDKKEPAYVDFCEDFASKGYVTASMNYRMGFHVGKADIERAGCCALEDARAAIRYLVGHAREYGIDPDRIYLAGSSAGSMTALRLAFGAETGGSAEDAIRIRAVANMWGSMESLDSLANSRSGIISFHGDHDNAVPYAEGHLMSSAGVFLSRFLSDVVYGSSCIDSAARAIGLRSELWTFEGCGHALNVTGSDKAPNENHQVIKDRMTMFFFRDMVPEDAAIVSLGEGVYELSGRVESVQWNVDGGFVLGMEGNRIRVLWRADADTRTLMASGTYPGGIGYLVKL